MQIDRCTKDALRKPVRHTDRSLVRASEWLMAGGEGLMSLIFIRDPVSIYRKLS